MASSVPTPSFIAAVSREIKQHYSALGREPQVRARHRLGQFWWGPSGAVHYEIAIHERFLQLELGLHFEATPARNLYLLQLFADRLLEIQEQLGDSIWLEEWDRGWTRLYETQPLGPLDDERVYAVASRMCEIIDCLQPMLESIEPSE